MRKPIINESKKKRTDSLDDDDDDSDYYIENYEDNKDYSNDLELTGETAIITRNFIENMREPIRQLSDHNKEKTVRYLSNLIKISELV